MTNVLTIGRNRDNDKLPAYAWPGGYPIYYLTPQSDVLCADCATDELDQWCDADWRGPSAPYPTLHRNYYDGPQTCDINYEDDDMYCAGCNEHIAPAYGKDE